MSEEQEIEEFDAAQEFGQIEAESTGGSADGFPHQLTDSERLRGAMSRSERKARAARLNPVKTGAYATTVSLDFVNCNGCGLKKACFAYRRDSTCQIVGIEAYKNLALIWRSSPEEFLQEIARSLGQFHIKAVASDNPGYLAGYSKLLMEMFSLRFGKQGVGGDTVNVKRSYGLPTPREVTERQLDEAYQAAVLEKNRQDQEEMDAFEQARKQFEQNRLAAKQKKNLE